MNRLFLSLLLVPALAACKHSGEADAAEPEIRPVLSQLVNAGGEAGSSFVGSVQARTSTQLAFRVGGRVTKRSVSVGDKVRRGDEIGRLDPQSLKLAVDAAAANLQGLRAERDNAHLTLQRQASLFAQQTSAQSNLDDARLSRDTAVATVAEAEARLQKAREDLGYAVLRADLDGVITRVDFEVDQTLAPNVTVAELAQPTVLDDVFDVPETVGQDLAVGDAFTVRSSTPPEVTLVGKVRQISPAADRTTRTRRVLVALDGAPADLRIGATTYAARAGAADAALRVPTGALVDADAGTSAVWVVEGGVVQQRAVTLGARTSSTVVVTQGLKAGERVVTAGVHSLRAGQAVKLLEGQDR